MRFLPLVCILFICKGAALGLDPPSGADTSQLAGGTSSAASHRLHLAGRPQIIAGIAAAALLQVGLIAGLLLHRRRQGRIEAALRVSEERYREVVESQTEMVCRFRPDTTLTFVNEAYCRFFGKRREELLGRQFLSLIPSEGHSAISEMLRTVVQKQRVSMEHEVLRPDGSTGWMEWEDFAILDQHGNIVELQGIGRDVTERRRAVEARLEAERKLALAMRLALVGELTASIAHEINQPLGAILSNADAAELLLERGSLDEVRQILGDIRKDDIRASKVIEHVRNLLGKDGVTMAPVQINEKVRDVLRLITGDAESRGVRLILELSSDLPDVNASGVQIEQLVLNLVLNAMEAMKNTPAEERRMIIRTSCERGGEIEISVTDAGHGIAPGDFQRLFESFFTTKQKGMGLGLALSRSIAEAHRGSITGENNPVAGATFRFRLPTNGNHFH